MQKKENTPARISRRKYEETNKEKRKRASKVFGTSIDRKFCEEIEAFLIATDIKNKISDRRTNS